MMSTVRENLKDLEKKITRKNTILFFSIYNRIHLITRNKKNDRVVLFIYFLNAVGQNEIVSSAV